MFHTKLCPPRRLLKYPPTNFMISIGSRPSEAHYSTSVLSPAIILRGVLLDSSSFHCFLSRIVHLTFPCVMQIYMPNWIDRFFTPYYSIIGRLYRKHHKVLYLCTVALEPTVCPTVPSLRTPKLKSPDLRYELSRDIRRTGLETEKLERRLSDALDRLFRSLQYTSTTLRSH